MSDTHVRKTSVLIISPHPDDAEFAMGGTLLSLVGDGVSVDVAVMTDGGAFPGASPAERRREQDEAARVGGYNVHYLGVPDGELAANATAIECCRQLIVETKPQCVFMPYPRIAKGQIEINAHPDHEAAAEIAVTATLQARIPGDGRPSHRVDSLLCYDLPRGVKPHLYIDVTSTMSLLEALLSVFHTQVQSPKRTLEVLLAQRVALRPHSGGVPAEPFVLASPIVACTRDVLKAVRARGVSGASNSEQ